MPKKTQVGGLQEVFLHIAGKTLKDVERSIKAVVDVGGRVTHVYPPIMMVAMVPTDKVSGLAGKAGITAARTDPFPAKLITKASHDLGLLMTAWNEHVGPERKLRAMASPTMGKSWDSAGFKPPDPPKDVLKRLRALEASMAPARSAAKKDIAGSPVYSIPVLMGRIAVGLVYVDSTVAQYQIADTEKSTVLNETTEGLNMLAGFEPRAGIQWFYNLKRPKISLTASQFPSNNQNGWEDLWRNAALQAMGYTGDLAGMNKYIADIKAANNADWAYAIFVTKYPKTWFGYQWGNHVVMDFSVDGWGLSNFNLVVAHETGHVFGCGDEYSSSGCNCTSLFGRYQVANGNCENCASPFVQCLMAHNSQSICDYSRGQLGWNELAVQSEGKTVLKGTWTFDLDTGVQGPAGGADIWWEQVNTVTRLLVPQNGAMLCHMGKPNFDAVSYQTLKAKSYTTVPIDGSNNSGNKLPAGTVIGVKTSAGRYAKIRIDAYGYNLSITWVTYK